MAERFAREARLAAQLRHRPIVGTYEVGEVDSHAVDRRTDIWAVGVILFELLTGERSFCAERDKNLLKLQILNVDPPPPSQLNSQVPADLDTLCLKCLEKDPSRRFPTAADLAQELHRFLHGEPIHFRPFIERICFASCDPRSTRSPNISPPSPRTKPSAPRPPTRPAIRPRLEIALECGVSAPLWSL